MRCALVMLDDPFYLPRYFDEFLSAKHGVVSLVVLTPAKLPKENFAQFVRRVYGMYGAAMFIRQAALMVFGKVMGALAYFFPGIPDRSLAAIARKYQIPVIQEGCLNSNDFLAKLSENRIDLLISLACPQIFGKKLLAYPSRGCLNVHGALLPYYRGVFSAFWVLYHEEKVAGATAHYMSEKVDGGPIVEQAQIPIEKGETVDSLCRKTAGLGFTVLAAALDKIANGQVAVKDNPAPAGRYHTYPTAKDRQEFLRKGKRFF